jgi:hypothetical protein
MRSDRIRQTTGGLPLQATKTLVSIRLENTMRYTFTSVLTLFLLCFAGASVAQSRATVDVRHSGEDSVGRTLAFAVREAIRSSAGYELVTGPRAAFRILLVTLDPDRDSGSSGLRTIASVTLTMRNHIRFDDREPQTWYPIYLTSLVTITGTGKVDTQAKSILAALEEQILEYQKEAAAKK